MKLYESFRKNLNESVSSGSEELNSNLIPFINVTVYGDETLYDYLYSVEELDKAIITAYEPLMNECVKDILPSANIKCTSVYHPKYYNFEGDNVEFTMTFNPEEFNALEKKIIYDNPDINSVLHDKFKSYDGFLSYMADNLEDYETQEDFRKVATVFIIAGQRFIDDEQLQSEYDDDFHEYVYSNFEIDPESELYEEAEKKKVYKYEDFNTLEDALEEVKKVKGPDYVYLTKEELDNISPEDFITCNYYIEDIVDNVLNESQKKPRIPKKLKEAQNISDEFTYQGYTFVPVGNVRSNQNMSSFIGYNKNIDDAFKDYNYVGFYQIAPSVDLFRIKELNNALVIPVSGRLATYNGGEDTYTPVSDLLPDEELWKADSKGYVGDADDKQIVSDIKKKSKDYRAIAYECGWALNSFQLYNLATLYIKQEQFREKIEDLLTDINYHSECSELAEDPEAFRASLMPNNSLNESCKKPRLLEYDEDAPYMVEVWDTEEDRDQGYGYVYDYFKTRDEAIEEARKVWRRQDPASVEVSLNKDDGNYGILVIDEDGETFYDEDLKGFNESEESGNVFYSFRDNGQSEGLLGRLWFKVNDKPETIDLFKDEDGYKLVYGTYVVPNYIKEFVDSLGGYDAFLKQAIDFYKKEKGLNEAEKSEEGYKKDLFEKHPELKDVESYKSYADDDWLAVDFNEDGSVKGVRLATKLKEGYNYFGTDVDEPTNHPNMKSHMEKVYTLYDCFGEVDQFKTREEAERYIEEHKDDEMYTDEYCQDGPNFEIEEETIEVLNNKIIVRDDLVEADSADWKAQVKDFVDRNVDDWSLDIDGDSFCFEAWSPAGEDLIIEFEASTLDEFINAVRAEANSFDIDDHVGLWIDQRGQNGVPGRVSDLLEDAYAISRMYNDLYDKFRAYKKGSLNEAEGSVPADIQKLIDIAEDLGWGAEWKADSGYANVKGIMTLETWDSSGGDFYVELPGETAEEIINALDDYNDGYDVDEEFNVYYEAGRGGLAGVPEPRELLAAMEERADLLQRTLDAFQRGGTLKEAEEFSEELKPYLDIELEDDVSPRGGTAFAGEKVRDFLEEDFNIKTPEDLDAALIECGIKPVANKNPEVELWVNGKIYWSGDYSDVDDSLLYDVIEQADANEIDEVDMKLVESEKLKESAYADNKLLDVLKLAGYDVVSVHLDEGKQEITFRVPHANKTKSGTTLDPDYDDGYLCATADFISILEDALSDMGMNVDVYGEGESASDFGTFTLSYEPVARGLYSEAEIRIPRNASKITIGDEEYFKGPSGWQKTSEKDRVLPIIYPIDALKMKSKLDGKELKVTGTDENYKPKKTREYKVLQGNYGTGWDDLVSYDTKDEQQMKDLKQNKKDYRDNEPNVPHRVITRRVPVDEAEAEFRDNALVIPSTSLKGSGIPKHVEATYTPGCLKVENEEWGFFVYNGEVDFDSMQNMSQYWFYDDYENREDFKAKIDKAAKALYKKMDKMYKEQMKGAK